MSILSIFTYIYVKLSLFYAYVYMHISLCLLSIKLIMPEWLCMIYFNCFIFDKHKLKIHDGEKMCYKSMILFYDSLYKNEFDWYLDITYLKKVNKSFSQIFIYMDNPIIHIIIDYDRTKYKIAKDYKFSEWILIHFNQIELC